MSFNYRHVLITGGAGFVGSNLAIRFKTCYPDLKLTVADNLKRRGSEMNLPRLKEQGIEFVHADIRNKEDLSFNRQEINLIIECSAEPSVLAGYNDSPDYVINTNLVGTINCLELARRKKSDLIFLSTSRVYPITLLNSLNTIEEETRFTLRSDQPLQGASEHGISEYFPLNGARSLYGTTKLSSELLIEEYAEMYGLKYIINRCGVLSGPWQMGKVDQGVFALWVAMHYFKRDLSYIGWGGQGKQVRDLLHVEDLADLLEVQLNRFDEHSNKVYNAGGGTASSLSLLETTHLCQQITGNIIPVKSIVANRPADLKTYITDKRSVEKTFGWTPRYTPLQILTDIFNWMHTSEKVIGHLWQ